MTRHQTSPGSEVTVLGGGGFIGSHLVRYLQQHGQPCHAPQKGDEAVFSRPLGHVIYAIGLTADFRSRPYDTVEAHVCFLRRLLQQADFESLTYLSSTRLYSGVSDTTESATLQVNPNDVGDLYNLSKLMGESLCLHGGRQNMKIVRLSNVVGIRPDPDIFIEQLLEEGQRTGKVLFRTSLESKKDFLHIDDAVTLMHRIACSPHNGIFNVASGEGVTNREIASALQAQMGYDVSVAADAPVWDFTEINISKVKHLFGFAPKRFSEYFPEYLRSYRHIKGI
ncbi:MAG TPA: NAD(P)-dependent oxidoreductase [Burkholderiaceae bacterium]|nr:NAD(P)-dependent oxidoreductase [Burkholderiaceae bacterium]